MNDTIYTQNNPYGYKINVNHPQIKPLYERYKKKYNILIPTDEERKNFEDIIIKMIKERNSC